MGNSRLRQDIYHTKYKGMYHQYESCISLLWSERFGKKCCPGCHPDFKEHPPCGWPFNHPTGMIFMYEIGLESFREQTIYLLLFGHNS